MYSHYLKRSNPEKSIILFKVMARLMSACVIVTFRITSDDKSESEEGSLWMRLNITWIKRRHPVCGTFLPVQFFISSLEKNSHDPTLLHSVNRWHLLFSLFWFSDPSRQKLHTVCALYVFNLSHEYTLIYCLFDEQIDTAHKIKLQHSAS